jgi:hypothetical protein
MSLARSGVKRACLPRAAIRKTLGCTVAVSRVFAALVALPAATFAISARAQDPAAAASLFQTGLTAMQEGRYSEGCPALEESYRLEPLPGVLFTSAECHAKWGKLATAVARYQDYLTVFERLPPSQVVKQRNRNEVAERQIRALSARVPQLTLTLPPSAPATITVKRDGVVLGAPSLGVALPVDPGEHVLVTERSGVTREQRVSLAEGERRSVVLEVPPEATAPEAVAPPLVRSAPPARTHAHPRAHSPWFWVAGGAGVVGVATGAVCGALVFAKKSDIDDNCTGYDCNAEGKQAADSAKTLAFVSTVGFAVGAAGVAAASVLLLTAPKHERQRARRPDVTLAAGQGSAMIGLSSRF